MAIVHTGFISSRGTNGWYETIEEDEIIEFKNPTNSLAIETDTDPLKIKINNIEDIWYIKSESKDGIEGLKITKIQILEPAGTKIRWKALTY